jgi:hypothetical protein
MLELRTAVDKAIKLQEDRPTVQGAGLIIGGLAGGAAGAASGDALMAAKFAGTAFLLEKIITDSRVQVAAAKAVNKANLAIAKAGKFGIKGVQPAFQAGRAEEVTREARPRPGIGLLEALSRSELPSIAESPFSQGLGSALSAPQRVVP